MEKENIKEILQKVGKEKLSAEEEAKAQRWLLQLQQQEPSGLSEEQIQDAKAEILDRLEQPGTRKPVRRLWPAWAAAVAVVVALLTGILYDVNRREAMPQSAYGGDVDPGKDGATLTLADGTTILIDEALTGNIAEQSGVLITKDADGRISYEIVDGETGTVGYNTLATARGEQTTVRLPDGTLVSLNASSSLRYPTSFAHSEVRSVSLAGEGYFQVAKNPTRPFIVETPQQQVRVLGTRFNINTYDPALAVTTLEEGAVMVSSGTANQHLKPGQQVLNDGRELTVAEADLDQVLGWKDGDFVFMGADMKTVMDQLARWYDVEVSYEGTSIDGVFYANISRHRPISEILKIMEKTNGVHFKIQGRRVIVMK